MSFIFQRECGALSASSQFLRRVSSRPGIYQRFALDCELDRHTGPMNDACFNQTGELLLSGSDDCRVNLWNLETRELRTSWQTTHTSNIFSVIFLPLTNGGVVASAAGDGLVQSHDLVNETTGILTQHNDRVKVIQVFPDMPQVVVSGSEDKTMKEIDLRKPNAKRILKSRDPLHSFDICKTKPWLMVVGGTSDVLRVFDRRKLGARTDNPKAVWSVSLTDLHKIGESGGITGVKFSSDGSQVLADFIGNYVYLLSLLNEESGKMELPTQKRKRAEHPSTSSSESDPFDNEWCMRLVEEVIQYLSRGDFLGCRNLTLHFALVYGEYWKMDYILVKCHIFEGNLKLALSVVKEALQQYQNSAFIQLESEIMKLKTNTTQNQQGDNTGVDYQQIAEMMNVLDLEYFFLFPNGILAEDYERTTSDEHRKEPRRC